MGIGSSNNPYGYTTPYIDRLIGDAFPIVKRVYDNMELIQLVGESLSESNIGIPLLSQRGVIYNGSTGLAGETTSIMIEDLDINYMNILSSSVRVHGTNNVLYFDTNPFINTNILPDSLQIALTSDAPEYLENSPVQWFFIYGVTN